jgi:nucleoside-diphosphate-sugar epimerase
MEEFDALVTGGSGFLWKYLLGEPLCARFRLCFLGRTPPGRAVRFECVDLAAPDAGECKNLRSLRSRFFLHFAAPTPKPESKFPLAEADRVAMNAASIALLCGARRLIHASSGAVYGQSWGAYRSEEDPTAPVTDYGKSKKSAENILDSFFTDEAADRRATHLRLHFLTPSTAALLQAVAAGDCARLWTRLARDVLNDCPIRLEPSAFWMNPCPDGALVELLKLLLEGQEPPAPVLNVAGARAVTLEQAVLELGKRLGKPPRFERGTGTSLSMLADTRRLRSMIGKAIELPLF